MVETHLCKLRGTSDAFVFEYYGTKVGCNGWAWGEIYDQVLDEIVLHAVRGGEQFLLRLPSGNVQHELQR